MGTRLSIRFCPAARLRSLPGLPSTGHLLSWQSGFVAPLSAEERLWAAGWLPAPALLLFQTMSAADQRHSLRVCRGLLARGCEDKDLLAAALLHDVGKAQGRVPFW